MQAGHLRIVDARVQLAPLVDGVLQTMAGEARDKGLALESHVPPEAWVRADEDRLVQVLINLVENATQFTPPGGSVRVLASVLPSEVEVEVRDTGVGVAPEVLGRLFQPFAQAEQGVPRTEGGTGLGLFICKGLVEAHGGRIWCTSDGPGKGASFHVTLPLAEPAPLADAPPPARRLT